MSHSSLLIGPTIGLLVCSLFVVNLHADEPLFSGPQAGEKLPGFSVQRVLGDQADDEFDFVKDADGKPLVLVFFHEKTRPAFGLNQCDHSVCCYAI